MRTIPFSQYRQVMHIGSAPRLKELLRTKSPSQLEALQAWATEADPAGEPFTILEHDEYPMPDTVQRLYGQRYLNALNALLLTLKEVRGTYALDKLLRSLGV